MTTKDEVSNADTTLVLHERHADFEEMKDWLCKCAVLIQQTSKKFPQSGKLNSNNYSQHASTLTAKEFFVAKVLSELLESSVKLFDAASDLIKSSIHVPEQQDFMNAMRSANDKSLLAANRKLLELLTTLILFQSTDQDEYHEHFLLLTELEQLLSKQSDEREFFAKDGKVIQSQIEGCRKKILELENRYPNLKKAWYLNQDSQKVNKHTTKPSNNKKVQDVYTRPGKIFSSYRSRFISLDCKLNDFEKLAMGFSYGALYSHASKGIHFTASEAFSADFPDVMEIALNVVSHSLLSLSILKRLQELTGNIVPGLDENIENLSSQVEPITKRMSQTFSPGDFVIAELGLAEIVKEHQGKFGYRSYEVTFLESASPEVDNCYLAKDLTFFASKQTIEEFVLSNRVLDSVDLQAINSGNSDWKQIAKILWKSLKNAEQRGDIKMEKSSSKNTRL